jgi:zinc protease
MYEAFPPLATQNNAREAIRPTPRGGRRGGVVKEVEALTPEVIQAYWQRYYKPRNAILVLAGAIDVKKAGKAVDLHFSRLAPGEKVPVPAEPGTSRYGVRTLPGDAPGGNGEPTACVAYAAPAPGTALYVPFQVLATRLSLGAEKLGNGSPAFRVYFTPLDDGAVVAVSARVKAGETLQQAIARLQAFVADTIGAPLGAGELEGAQQQLGFFLGTVDIPDEVLGNVYGVAFTVGRRTQLGMNPVELKRALEAVSDKDLKRVAAEVFAPARSAGIVTDAK